MAPSSPDSHDSHDAPVTLSLSAAPRRTADQTRQTPRLALPVAYTLVRVRRHGEERYRWTGHIYDVSATGMRFELDAPVDPGTRVEVRAMLPGADQVTFRAVGRVVRVHTDEEDLAGPVAMGLLFEKFPNPADRQQLLAYLDQRGLAAAA